MTEQVVAGVDFSGAKAQPNETWLTVAKAGALGIEVLDVRKVGSHALPQILQEHPSIKALGIDCPFSFPIEFIEFFAAKRLKPNFQSWQELAQELVFTSLDELTQIAKEFKKEPKRFTDKNCNAPAQSPLHRANPSMLPMTYHGMRLLAMLDPAKYFVLPFQSALDFGCPVIEIYPRATLNALKLTETGYKSQEKSEQERMQATRTNMLAGLVGLREKKGISYQEYPRLTAAKRFEKICIDSDHALDSLIACYTTGCFLLARKLFDDPLSADNLDVLLEGWIYALKPPN